MGAPTLTVVHRLELCHTDTSTYKAYILSSSIASKSELVKEMFLEQEIGTIYGSVHFDALSCYNNPLKDIHIDL